MTATARPTPTTARPTPTTVRPTGTYDSGDDGSDDGSTRTVAAGVDARGGGGDCGSDDEPRATSVTERPGARAEPGLATATS